MPCSQFILLGRFPGAHQIPQGLVSRIWHPYCRQLSGPLDAGPKSQVKFLDPDPRFKTSPKFTPDGKALVYVIHEKGTDNLWLQTLDGSPGRQVTNFQGDAIQYYLFSPDGKTLGVMRTHIESDVVLLHDTGSSPQ
jgi:hypothetical protein